MIREASRLAAAGELGNSDAIRLLQIPHSKEDVQEALHTFEQQLSREAKSKLTLDAFVPPPSDVDNERYEPLFDKYIIMDDVEVENVSDKLTAIGVSGPTSLDVLQAAGFEIPEVHLLQVLEEASRIAHPNSCPRTSAVSCAMCLGTSRYSRRPLSLKVGS
jgi:hypothetical protein